MTKYKPCHLCQWSVPITTEPCTIGIGCVHTLSAHTHTHTCLQMHAKCMFIANIYTCRCTGVISVILSHSPSLTHTHTHTWYTPQWYEASRWLINEERGKSPKKLHKGQASMHGEREQTKNKNKTTEEQKAKQNKNKQTNKQNKKIKK